MLTLLNFFDRKGFYSILSVWCSIMYFVRGKGLVSVRYLKEHRAYMFHVRQRWYLSVGPGWAYSFDYLLNTLKGTFCYFYLPKPGDTVIDLGAGLGEESVVFADLVGSSGRVFAIEANPPTCAALQHVVDKNALPQVTVLNLAVYGENTEVEIEDTGQNYLENTINKASQRPSFRVKARTLDSIVDEFGIEQIDLLKTNIEGAEQFLVQGMLGSLPRLKNACISCHDFRFYSNNESEFYKTKEKVVAFFKDNGFKVTFRNTGSGPIDDLVYASRY